MFILLSTGKKAKTITLRAFMVITFKNYKDYKRLQKVL